jgi:glycosyltransferase involved in cell wall biosynthesis
LNNENKDINDNQPERRKDKDFTKKRRPFVKLVPKEKTEAPENPQPVKIDKPLKQVNQQQLKNKNYIKDDSILSVVIPLYNEEESLPELALQLESELNKLTKGRFEVIFVDDGSTDKSFQVLRTIHERNRKFRAIRFRRNYGKSAALSVGFSEAKGLIVCTMDADLQDDPSEIRNLVDKLKEGYDLVSGWKKKRHDPITKTIPSRFFNFVTSKMSKLKLHDFNCGLKIYRREVIKSIQVYGEMHRYIPALAHFEGFRIAEIPVKHHPRRYGKSKYGFSRMIKGYLDLLTVMFTTRYLKRPLHFFGTVGSLFAGAGFAIDLYLLVEWFLDKTALSNRPLLLFGIGLIIVGVQLISLGLVGELVTKSSIDKNNYNIMEKI